MGGSAGRRVAAFAAASLIVLAGTAAARLGEIDTSYGTGGVAALGIAYASDGALMRDGGFLIADGSRAGHTIDLAKLTALGRPDKAFGNRGALRIDFGDADFEKAFVSSVAVQGDGNVLIAVADDGNDVADLLRVTPAGALDPAFGTNGRAAGSVFTDPARRLSEISDLRIDPLGRILVFGTTATSTGSEAVIVRLNPNGSPDPSFGLGGLLLVSAPGAQSSSSVAGTLLGDQRVISIYNQDNQLVMARTLGNGQADSTLGGAGRVSLPQLPGRIADITRTSRGLTLAGPGFLAGITQAGALDLAFGTQGITRTGTFAITDITAAKRGIVAAGYSGPRYNSATAEVRGFDALGRPNAVFGNQGAFQFREPGDKASWFWRMSVTGNRLIVIGNRRDSARIFRPVAVALRLI